MLEINFETLLKIVPISDSLKDSMRQKYSVFSPAQQSELTRMLWRMYRVYWNILRSQTQDEYTEKMVNGEYEPPADFEKFLDDQADLKIKTGFHAAQETQELDEVRAKLEQFLKSA